MKSSKIILVVFLLSTVLFSCKKDINGSGNFISQTRIVPPFTDVRSSGDYVVILMEDSIPHIELVGEDNILPEIETVVTGNELGLYYTDNNKDYNTNGVTITIYNPAFKGVDLQGSGIISGNTILDATNMHVNNSGSGDINLSVSGTDVTSNISGSGDITLMGDVFSGTHTISGSGKIRSFGLISNNAKATISGSGFIELYALDFLDATISGSGDVIYKGNPVVTKHISGSGKVRHY